MKARASDARPAGPVVAILGRPNVGKSALFNRLISRRVAIVEDTPGVTRDRLYAAAEWRGRQFVVIDTGGLRSQPAGSLETRVREQATVALAGADLVLLVVDARDGIVPEDREIVEMVRRTRVPVLLEPKKLNSRRGR